MTYFRIVFWTARVTEIGVAGFSPLFFRQRRGTLRPGLSGGEGFNLCRRSCLGEGSMPESGRTDESYRVDPPESSPTLVDLKSFNLK